MCFIILGHPRLDFGFLSAGLYTAGFPCTPFSFLHNDTELLADENARQFFAVRDLLKDGCDGDGYDNDGGDDDGCEGGHNNQAKQRQPNQL